MATDSPQRPHLTEPASPTLWRGRPPALMFGVPIDDLTMDETMDMIADLVSHGRRTGCTHQIATVNVDFLVNALANPEVADILRRADVCLADGMPVVWGSRALKMPIRARVAGSDLVPLMVEASARRGWHVHVFGSAPDVAHAATRLLRARHPDANFSIDSGPMIKDVRVIDDDVLDGIRQINADILCVALGNPKQERFIAAHRERLGVPVMIGVGGSLDMLVGHRRRAPKWMQVAGLEWVARAAQEPRRLGVRYARDARVFAPAIAHAYWDVRRRRALSGLRLNAADDLVDVSVGGTQVLTDDEWDVAVRSVVGGASLVIRAESDRSAHDAAAAQLIGLVRSASRVGACVHWLTDDGLPSQWAVEFGLSKHVGRNTAHVAKPSRAVTAAPAEAEVLTDPR